MKRLMCMVSLAVAALATLVATAGADPCGMVPPIRSPQQDPIARIGIQQSYVFYHKGVESILIHPGFKGGVPEFGMLIPFPTPPAMRKVPENIFGHIAAAVDPPEVALHVGRGAGVFGGFGGGGIGGGGGLGGAGLGVSLKKDEVHVLREEAVGMYEVAVLAAGSARALNLWMTDHGFRYPRGMDGVCNEYIKMKWCFVAVKAKVGVKGKVDPRPGQRNVDARLPKQATFDGHVQAMAFRFRSPKLVVPMRLSAYNKGSLRNIVYLLADTPASIRGIPAAYVRRQIPGAQLYKNLTEPLPLRVHGAKAITLQRIQTAAGTWLKLSDFRTQRNPRPNNGLAADLFVADLTAVASRRLALPYETKEKSLNDIAERLGLRHATIDELNRQAYESERIADLKRNRRLLQQMTLTVIDGEFARDFIAKHNLTFRRYLMPLSMNTPRKYDAKLHGPRARPAGVLISETSFPGATDQALHQENTSASRDESVVNGGPAPFPTLALSMFVVVFATTLVCRHGRVEG